MIQTMYKRNCSRMTLGFFGSYVWNLSRFCQLEK